MSIKASSAGAITVHIVVVPSGELLGKGRYGVLCGVATVWFMPERYRCGAFHLALYKCPATLLYLI